jgi:hypothetical protein
VRAAEDQGRVEGRQIVGPLPRLEIVHSDKGGQRRIHDKGPEAEKDDDRLQPPRISTTCLAKSSLLWQRERGLTHLGSSPIGS